MLRYVLKRLLLVIPLLLLVSLFAFLIVHIMPGDAASILAGEGASEEDISSLTRVLGLDRPLYEQYGLYLGRVLQGDLGKSLITGSPVGTLISLRYPVTLKLALAGLVIALVLGTLLGIASAVQANRPFDSLTRIVALLGVSTPPFFLGLLLMFTCAVQFRWFPIQGGASLAGFVLPAVALSARTLALIARMTRSSMLNVLSQDYILLARAQGLGRTEVIVKHALKNVLNTIITVAAVQLGYLLGGSVVIESVFAMPGIGRLLVEAILGRDVPLMQGTLLVVAMSFIVINLVVDVLYAVINPRIVYK